MATEVSDCLKANIDKIMRHWEAEVRKTIPAARIQNQPDLWNTLPGFLYHVAEALSPLNIRTHSWDVSEVCKTHGAVRATLHGYALEQVVMEYKILREMIFKALEDAQPLPIEYRDVILDAIYVGISEACTEYTRILQTKREEFAITLTHDLRGPLTAIKASAGLIQRMAEKPDLSRTYAGRIIDCVNRTDKMIRDVLDAHRVRAGERLPLELAECDLKRIVEEVCRELATIYGDRFRVIADSEEVRGIWSAEELWRVVENLVTNAVKYGSPMELITLTIRKVPNQRVRLEVHNFGNPMKPEEIATLFQTHHRTGAARSSGQKGWGLGLTLVRGVAEAHGGAVSVTSNEKDGTTFAVEIPQDARPFRLTEAS